MKLTVAAAVLLIGSDVLVTSFVPPHAQRLELATTCFAQKQQVDREWVERDLKKASKAEKESRDWVAEDMNKVGENVGGPTRDDWIFRGLKKAGEGEGGEHQPTLRKQARKTSKKYDAIARDMASTGSASREWVSTDMQKAGAPDEDSKFTTSSWQRHLNEQLDEERDKKFKDIRDDMKKTGKGNGDSTVRVERDMQKTGRAEESPFDHMSTFFKDVSYKLDEWMLKAFHPDDIKKDMESGGRTTDQSWVGHDMEMTGKHHSVESYRAPEQKKELREELSPVEHNKWVAKDMQEGGDPIKTWRQVRDDRMNKHKTESLVAEDIRTMGSAASNEMIREHMEDAGHPDSHPLGRSRKAVDDDQYKREVREFKETVHHKTTHMPKAEHKHMSWEPEPEEKDKHPYLHFSVRLLKKIAMPWKDWENL